MTADLRQNLRTLDLIQDEHDHQPQQFRANHDLHAPRLLEIAQLLRAELDRTRAELAEADRHVSPRYWAGFAEHAAIEAIDANLTAARRRLRRHEQYIARLEALRTERTAAVSEPTD